ncbi:MAG: methyltransferase [bacterium]
MTKHFFHKEHKSNIFDHVQNILEQQAELFMPKIIKNIKPFGFGSDKHILDFGCGVGASSLKLHKEFKNSHIVAVDINDDLLKRFETKLTPDNKNAFTIINWNAEQDNAPEVIKDCHSVFIGLVCQHMKDPVKTLSNLRKSLPKNTLVAIIEEDDAYLQAYPETYGIKRIFQAWNEFEAHNQENRKMGRCIPAIVKEAGYELIHYDILIHTDLELGMENLADYFLNTINFCSLTTNGAVTKEEIDKVAHDIETFIQDNKKGAFFYFPHVLTIAKT